MLPDMQNMDAVLLEELASYVVLKWAQPPT